MNRLEWKVRMTTLKDQIWRDLRQHWYIDGKMTNRAERLMNGDVDLEKDKDVIKLMTIITTVQLALNDVELEELES